MLKIKTAATTSNFAIGFDAIGMSLNLYNEYVFIESDSFILSGFEIEYRKNNFVLEAYKNFCFDNGLTTKEMKKVKITLFKQEIPIERGLGSSAACIVAGIIAANKFNDLHFTLAELAAYAAKVEGHPDNVYSVIFGGLNVTFKQDNQYINEEINLSDELNFALLVPNAKGNTEELRNGLPQSVKLEDAVFHLSRTLQLPKALTNGDFDKLKLLIQDKLHEEYRKNSIPRYDIVKELANELGVISFISGSGPSLVLISDNADFSGFEVLSDTFRLIPVKVGKGVELI